MVYVLQCRLIVAQMSDTRCQVLNPFLSVCVIALVAVMLSNDPKFELSIMWTITVAMTLAHIHYGIVVVSVGWWLELPNAFLWMRVCCNRTASPNNPSWAGEPGRGSDHFHATQRVGSGHSIITLVATAYGYPLVTFFDSLSLRLHYSAPNEVRRKCRLLIK